MSKLIYRDISCDSYEEVHFLMWVFELKEKGYIKSIDRCKTFLLSEPVERYYEEIQELKTKTKIVQKKKILLRGHIYTPEFLIIVNNSFEELSYDLEYNSFNEMYIEVKPSFDFKNMTRLNQINRKWLYQKHGVFVNQIIPKKLFEQTFTPKEYLKKKRK